MIWNIIKNKRLKIALILVITLTVLFCPFLESFGVYYAEEFPSSVGLAGGYFVKCHKGANDWCILIPDNYKDYLTFQGNGTLINTSSSTITCRFIRISDNTVYTGRFQAFSGFQYQLPSGTTYTWTDFTNYTVTDMNIYPKTTDPALANQNLHLSYDTRHLVIVLFFATLLIILFRSVKRD